MAPYDKNSRPDKTETSGSDDKLGTVEPSSATDEKTDGAMSGSAPDKSAKLATPVQDGTGIIESTIGTKLEDTKLLSEYF